MAGSIYSNENIFAIIADKILVTLDLKNNSSRCIQLWSDDESNRFKKEKIGKMASQPTGSSYVNISNNTEIIAVATDQKELLIWNLKDWKLLKRENLAKRPMAIEFSKDSKNVLVADKAGDVYSFPIVDDSNSDLKKVPYCDESGYTPDFEPGPEPILGHLSMLLGMKLSNNGKFIITCDRDEKIRVSHYPNCYNIRNFCFGHEEFVTCMRLLPNSNRSLLSASGDGTIRLWNFLEGSCTTVLDTRSDLRMFTKEHCIEERISTHVGKESSATKAVAVTTFQIIALNVHETLVVSAFDKLPLLLFYKLSRETFEFLGGYKLPAEPIAFTILESFEIIILKNLNEITNDENPITILKFDGHSVEAIKQVHGHAVLQLGENYQQQMKECFHPLDIDSLYKQRFDNMSDYLQRKQQRLQSKLPSKKAKCEL